MLPLTYMVLRLDGFAWLFSMLVLGIGTLVSLYARYYMSPEDPVPRFFAFFLAFMGAMLGLVLSGNLIQIVFFWELTSLFSFLLIEMLDTSGTLTAVAQQAGLLGPDGRLKNARRALASDAVGTMIGAALGTSPVTAYIESAAGVQAGGRTGLTAIVQDHFGEALTEPRGDITLQGWVRTRRDSKNCTFIEVNDGSSFKGIQVVADNALPCASLYPSILTGSSIRVK